MKIPGYPMANRTARGSSGQDLTRDIGYDYRRRAGTFLRERRIAAGLTQLQLSEALGIGYTAVSAMEVGRVSIPPDKYEAICDTLSVDKQEMARVMLRYSNPWLYALMFGKREKDLKADLDALPVRFKPK